MAEPDHISEGAAFDRLYREQGSPIRSFLRLLIGNSSTAEDLLQETFLHVWRRPHTCDPERGGVKAYLLGIARKKAAGWWRGNRHTEAAEPEPPSSTTDVLAIRDALNRLPEDTRTVLWLREVEGYSYEELAEILEIPVGTVRSRLHAARKQLRTIWTKETQ